MEYSATSPVLSTPAGIKSAGLTLRPVISVVADEAHHLALGSSTLPVASTAVSMAPVQFCHWEMYASVLFSQRSLG